MILKVVRRKKQKDDKETLGEIIVEYYEADSFKRQDGFMLTDEESIDISNYTIHDDIIDDFFEYNTQECYLMNNEGKTIERII